MMWHLRAVPTEAGECHCKLELFFPQRIREEARHTRSRGARDWQGKLARLLREGPSGLSEVEIETIIKPEV
jgi:hypothetical protein